MTPRLLLEPAAENEFLEAAGWYAERSPSLGAAFRTSVATTLTTIEEAPHRFPIALRDIRKARVPRFPYVVYYVPLAAAAYYRRSSNKQQAVDELLHIRDFHDVLLRSGYQGGSH